VPAPQADARGEILHTLAGKPAAVVTGCAGGSHLAPDALHCAQVGAMLARMHLAGADFPLQQPNLRGLAWWAETVPWCCRIWHRSRPQLLERRTGLSAAAGSVGGRQAAATRPHPCRPVPRQRDVRRRATTAGPPVRLLRLLLRRHRHSCFFDMAVCLNDWCIDLASGRWTSSPRQAFVAAYDTAVRPLASG
jgi:homoserine kinase type II